MTTILSIAKCALAVDGAPLIEGIRVVDDMVVGELAAPFRGRVEAPTLDLLEQVAREARDEQTFGIESRRRAR